MSGFDLGVYILRFLIPQAFFSIAFRAFGLGYRSRKRLIIGVFLYLGYLIIVPRTLILWMGYGQFTHISSVVMFLGTLLVLPFSTDSVGKTIFAQLVVGQVNTVVSTLLSMVRHAFSLSYLTLILMLLVVCFLMYCWMMRYLAKPLRFLVDHIHSEIYTLIAVPIITMLLINLIPIYPPQNFANHPVFCTLLMMLGEALFFFSMYTLYKNMRKLTELMDNETNQKFLRQSVQAMEQRLTMMDESARQMSIVNHDRKHFNNTLLELLGQGNTEQAMEILKQQQRIPLNQEQQRIPLNQEQRCYCANPAVNAAIGYYVAWAERSGIVCHIHAEVPAEPQVDSLELSTVLSNLMENAVNACACLPEQAERYLKMTVLCEGQLIIESENPYCGEILLDKSGCPTSAESGHGIGTKSILTFAERYGGEVLYQTTDGIFNVRLLC